MFGAGILPDSPSAPPAFTPPDEPPFPTAHYDDKLTPEDMPPPAPKQAARQAPTAEEIAAHQEAQAVTFDRIWENRHEMANQMLADHQSRLPPHDLSGSADVHERIRVMRELSAAGLWDLVGHTTECIELFRQRHNEDASRALTWGEAKDLFLQAFEMVAPGE